MEVSPAACKFLAAHRALTTASAALEATICETTADSKHRRKTLDTLSKVQLAIADTEELAHLAATGQFK